MRMQLRSTALSCTPVKECSVGGCFHRGRWRVITDKGTYTAGRLVLTAGAWMPSSGLVPELRVRTPWTAEYLQLPILLESAHGVPAPCYILHDANLAE